MALATLSIDLVAQLAQLQAGMDKAGRLAEKNAAQIESAYAKAAKVGQVLGAALGGAISVAGITAFVRATVDGIDKLNDLSDATGATIENLSALEDIGARTGQSIDVVGDAVLKLNKVLGDAKPGSETAKQLEAIGLSVSELQRIDPAEALRRFAVALAGFANDGNKARLVQDFLGKSAGQLAPFLRDLAEAGKLNATVTTQQAEEADKFNKMLASIDKNVTDAARALAGPLVQALNNTIEKFREGEKEGKTFFERYWRWVKDVYGIEQTQADPLAPLLERLRELDSLLNTSRRLTLFSGQATELESERKTLQAQVDAIRASRLTSTAGAGRGSVNPPATVPTLGGGGKPPPDKPPYTIVPMAPLGLGESALAALNAINATDVAKIAEINNALEELFALRDGGLMGGDASVDAAIEKLRGDLEALSPAAKAAAEERKRLDAILSQTPTAVFADVLTDIELINKAFDAGKLSVEQWADAVRVATAKLPKNLEKPLEQISEFSREASRNIQDALGDTILESMRGNSEQIEDIWKNMLLRMVAQAAAAQLSESLFGKGYGSSTSQLGGFFGWLGGQMSGVNGSHANGLAYVPFDGYRAELHRGERVLTADQARAQDAGMGGGPLAVINVQGDFGANAQKAVDVSLSRFLMKTSRRRGAGG